MDDSSQRRRFEALPEPVDPAKLITTKESSPPQDPERGRDTEHDFMLRYGFG